MSAPSPASRRRLPTPAIVAVAVLLGVPIVGPLLVSTYDSEQPELFGFPFFFWFQFLWIFVAVGFTVSAYRVVVRYEERGRRRPEEGVTGHE